MHFFFGSFTYIPILNAIVSKYQLWDFAIEFPFFHWLGILYGFFLLGISTVFIFYVNLRKAISFGFYGLVVTFGSMLIPFILTLLEPTIFPLQYFYLFSLDSFSYVSFSPIIMSFIVFTLFLLNKRKNYNQQAKVRKQVLELATTYTNLKLSKVAKLTGIDKDLIVRAVNEMINDKELYADYFYSSRKFAFNKRANLEEIDKLMELYNQWEEKTIGKEN